MKNEGFGGYITSYKVDTAGTMNMLLEIDISLYQDNIRWDFNSKSSEIFLMMGGRMINGYINSSSFGYATLIIIDVDEIKLFNEVAGYNEVYISSFEEGKMFERSTKQLSEIL